MARRRRRTHRVARLHGIPLKSIGFTRFNLFICLPPSICNLINGGDAFPINILIEVSHSKFDAGAWCCHGLVTYLFPVYNNPELFFLNLFCNLIDLP